MDATGPDPDVFSEKGVQALNTDILSCIAAGTKVANKLPKRGETYELYNSFVNFAQLLNLQELRILDLMQMLLKHGGYATNLMVPSMDNDEKMDVVVNANDFLLERIGNWLDEAAGIRKKEQLLVVESPRLNVGTRWNRESTDSVHSKANQLDDSDAARRVRHERGAVMRLLCSPNVARPQVMFADLIDNSEAPFVPRLPEKHNALEPPEPKVRVIVDGKPLKVQIRSVDEEQPRHPYKYELDRFQPRPWQLEAKEPIEPLPIEKTPLHFVKTKGELTSLCTKLKGETEFAVDLEHHSYRSFQGITCLMQISTRKEDFLVDTLQLWREMHILNDPFTDPNILKVLHGPHQDIQWMQRDFGIYVVNMFDTGHAMRYLGFPRLSLASLLKRYLNKDVDKHFQLADWRIRPLPEELVLYAREDTHYLLYCYDMLRNELIQSGNEQNNLLHETYQQSRDICLMEYRKPELSPTEHLKICERAKRILNPRQLYALKQLCAWRNKVARVEDESAAYVLPNHMMLQIADILPREVQGILACCNPVPPLVKQNLNELHHIVMQARDMPLSKLKEAETDQLDVAAFTKRTGLEMKRPHDFSHTGEDDEIISLAHRKNYQMVIEQMKSNNGTPSKSNVAIIARILQKKLEITPERGLKVAAKIAKGWMSPFEAYAKAIQLIKQETEEVPKAKSMEVPKKQDEVVQAQCSVSTQQPPEQGPAGASSSEPDRTVEEQLLSAPSPKRKRPPKVWESFVPFDYTSVSTDMFSKTQAKKGADKDGKAATFPRSHPPDNGKRRGRSSYSFKRNLPRKMHTFGNVSGEPPTKMKRINKKFTN